MVMFLLIWLSIEADTNSANNLLQASAIYLGVHLLFMTFFLFEVMARVLALENKSAMFRNQWLLLDVALTALMILPFIPGAAGCNLFQVLRVHRLASSVPELRILCEGLCLATRSAFFVLACLVLNLYVWAIVFTVLARGTSIGDDRFSNVPTSMHTLLAHGIVISGASQVMDQLREQRAGGILVCLFAIFLLMSFSLLALVFGVLCQTVSTIATLEKHRLTELFFANSIKDAWTACDPKEICASEETLVQFLTSVTRSIEEAGLDPSALIEAAPTIVAICKNGQGFPTVDAFASELVRSGQKGGTVATRGDVFRLLKAMRNP